MSTRRIMIVILLLVFIQPYTLQAIQSNETIMVQMRDGVRLATDICRPGDSNKHPVILYRTPYNKANDRLDSGTIQLLNAQGYIYIAQDCRGRFASEGIDSVFFTDGWGKRQDGYDTIDWIIKQEWSNGKVGIFGASACGITSYRAAGAAHPALVAVVAIVAPFDFYREVVYPGGEYRKAICENWIHGQGSDYMLDYFLQYPFYNSIWDGMNLGTRTDSIAVPILHIGGWYDCFSEGPVNAFNAMCNRMCAGPQKLIMGPWIHGTTGSDASVGQINYPDADFPIYNDIMRWLARWLTGQENGILDEANVRYYLMGDPAKTDEIGCQWLEADVWPPEDAEPIAFYLHNDGSFNREPPGADSSLSYTYDPANPVPTQGGANLTIKAGPYDQRAIGEREDVIAFTSDVLTAPVRVEGYVEAQLYISSNCPDTDFTLKLVDVYPDGREMLVVDGIARAGLRNGFSEVDLAYLTVEETVPLKIKLPPTAIVFNSGHRIKVCISSSNYPRYEINPNTANRPNDLSEQQVATNTIYCSQSNASSVILPLVESSTRVGQPIVSEKHFALFDNYPNPFNPKTTIRYQLSANSFVKLSVFNSLGQKLATLVSEEQSVGNYQVEWNASGMASGLYFYRIETNTYQQTKKMILAR